MIIHKEKGLWSIIIRTTGKTDLRGNLGGISLYQNLEGRGNSFNVSSARKMEY